MSEATEQPKAEGGEAAPAAEVWVPCACGTIFGKDWCGAVTFATRWWRTVHHAPEEWGGCGAGPVGRA